jgi:hypothetical protein
VIINIRGTSGAGKTHLVRRIMAELPNWQDVTFEGKLIGHRTRTQRGALVVIGPYREGKVTGGCDNIQQRETAFELIGYWAADADVIFEGLLLSEEVRRTVELQRISPVHVIFLNTPIDDCIASINERRRARGEEKPVNENNTRKRMKPIFSARGRLKDAGVTVTSLSREEAFLHVKELLL